jgi:uncharacterized repeat protein (TIGR01451 family)
MKTLITISSALIMLSSFAQAYAAGSIQLKTVAEVETTVTDERGKKETKRRPAAKVVPGTEVIYTITVKNSGDEAATNVVVTDPIPEHMIYIDGSASGDKSTITFSVDGGNNYASSEKLQVKNAAGLSQAAKATDYTHIRWVLNFTLKPNESAPVWFKARLN